MKMMSLLQLSLSISTTRLEISFAAVDSSPVVREEASAVDSLDALDMGVTVAKLVSTGGSPARIDTLTGFLEKESDLGEVEAEILAAGLRVSGLS